MKGKGSHRPINHDRRDAQSAQRLVVGIGEQVIDTTWGTRGVHDWIRTLRLHG